MEGKDGHHFGSRTFFWLVADKLSCMFSLLLCVFWCEARINAAITPVRTCWCVPLKNLRFGLLRATHYWDFTMLCCQTPSRGNQCNLIWKFSRSNSGSVGECTGATGDDSRPRSGRLIYFWLIRVPSRCLELLVISWLCSSITSKGCLKFITIKNLWLAPCNSCSILIPHSAFYSVQEYPIWMID